MIIAKWRHNPEHVVGVTLLFRVVRGYVPAQRLLSRKKKVKRLKQATEFRKSRISDNKFPIWKPHLQP